MNEPNAYANGEEIERRERGREEVTISVAFGTGWGVKSIAALCPAPHAILCLLATQS
jgi:hypothetical protein